MNKSVMELASELKDLWVELDNQKYPNSDNTAIAYVKLYAMLATQIEFDLTSTEIKKILQEKIDELKEVQ